jgi:hypothetical protein
LGWRAIPAAIAYNYSIMESRKWVSDQDFSLEFLNVAERTAEGPH